MFKKEEKEILKSEEKNVDKKEETIKSVELFDLSNEEKYQLNLENLLKAGVHFGHKKSRWNPKMKKFIFGLKSGVHIINLEKTLEMFQTALDVMKKIIENGEEIVFIGTKKQVKDLVKEMAEKLEMPYVNERWVGGALTNFENISRRVKYLVDTLDKIKKNKLLQLTKFEKNQLNKELDKIEEKMGGLKRMKRIPKAIFVLDVEKDELAIKEAKKKGVIVLGLVDTNSNPEKIDYPIPANDDAFSSLRYILGVILLFLSGHKTQEEDKKEG